MRLRGTLLLPLLLLPLAACGNDDEEPEAKAPETSDCMTHQEPAADLRAETVGAPEIGGLIGRSWEADGGRTDEDVHGTACATLDFQAPRGWKLVRAELKLSDWAGSTTVTRTKDPDFGLSADMWAYECVAIDAAVVLEHGGERSRWTGHTEISPRCEG